MQEDNNHRQLAEDMMRLFGSALGTAQHIKQDAYAQIRQSLETMLRNMDIVQREEFLVLKDMISVARREQISLTDRVTALETTVRALEAKHNKDT